MFEDNTVIIGIVEEAKELKQEIGIVEEVKFRMRYGEISSIYINLPNDDKLEIELDFVDSECRKKVSELIDSYKQFLISELKKTLLSIEEHLELPEANEEEEIIL